MKTNVGTDTTNASALLITHPRAIASGPSKVITKIVFSKDSAVMIVIVT